MQILLNCTLREVPLSALIRFLPTPCAYRRRICLMLLISIDLFAIAGTGLEYQLQLFAARTTCFLYAFSPLINYSGRRGSISIGRNKLSLLVQGAKNLGFSSLSPSHKSGWF